jgi:peroxiredoxin
MRRSLCVSIAVALMLAMGISTVALAWVVKSRYFDPYRYVSDGPPRVTLYDFDLFQDGRVVTNDSLDLGREPSPLFQRLPKDVAEAREGWESMGRNGESRLAYQLAGSAASDSWGIQATRYDPSFRIYLMSFRWKSFFDRKRGLIRRIASENTQGYGFVGKGARTVELVAVQQHDSDWTREFADESSHYFDTIRAYQELLTRAGADAEHTVALLAEAETMLKDARPKLGRAVLREGMDEKLADHKKLPTSWSKERKNRAAVIGHAAADWETTDLTGKRHALKDYRGKVVVLDFWYRGCFWCIRAMPQMIQVADDFRDQPVAVLGMNIDHEAKDAQFVEDQMKLNYPVLRAAELPVKYGVAGFPTLIIIDRNGKVADVHVGYSKTLHADVSKSVKRLLRSR